MISALIQTGKAMNQLTKWLFSEENYAHAVMKIHAMLVKETAKIMMTCAMKVFHVLSEPTSRLDQVNHSMVLNSLVIYFKILMEQTIFATTHIGQILQMLTMKENLSNHAIKETTTVKIKFILFLMELEDLSQIRKHSIVFGVIMLQLSKNHMMHSKIFQFMIHFAISFQFSEVTKIMNVCSCWLEAKPEKL